MNTESTDVKVARLEERVGTLQTDVTAIRTTLAGQDRSLAKLVAMHEQRKGARAVTKVLLGIAASSGILGWAWEHFSK